MFAGFWWTLNQEFAFKVEDWHFKLGIELLLVAMVMLGLFGVVLLLRAIAYANPAFDMGHYGVFKLPKYRTTTDAAGQKERFLFAATLLTVLGLIAKW